MNKHGKEAVRHAPNTGADEVLTYFLHTEIEPEVAGREAAEDAFAGFDASILALVAQQINKQACAD